MVTEQANEILIAVEERRNFILRTVIAIAIAIFIFSIFLNKYILTPIAALVVTQRPSNLKMIHQEK